MRFIPYPHAPVFKTVPAPEVDEKWLEPMAALGKILDHDSLILVTKGKGILDPEQPLEVSAIPYTRLRNEPGWAGIGSVGIVTDSEGMPIWGMRGPKVLYPNSWGIVGGHVDQGEELETTFRREFTEETGLDDSAIQSLEHLCFFVMEEDDIWVGVESLYLVKLLPGKYPLPTTEMTDWKTQKNVPSPVLPHLPHLLEAAFPYLDSTGCLYSPE